MTGAQLDAPDTIVLIHGLWMTPLVWSRWVSRYEERGFTVLTPGYPGIRGGSAGVAALRKDPGRLANVGVREVVDYLTEVVESLDTNPVIMGHCCGGMLVQLLLDAGYGSAGVSINGAGVKGVVTSPLAEVTATVPVLSNLTNARRAVPITEDEFHYAFTNTLTESQSRAVYDDFAVPVSGQILFQAGFANVVPHASTIYNFANDDRAPLLFISGGSDYVLPPAVQHENYRKNVKHSIAITAYKLFPGRDHHTCAADGWEAVADLALDWALDPMPGELD